MRDLNKERGSVLMEFVIVLPVYFMLLTFAFVVGELSVHSIHLTAGMDRGMALAYRSEDIEAAGAKVLGADEFIAEILKTLSLDKDGQVVDYDYAGSTAGGKDRVSEITATDHIDVVPTDMVDGHFIKAVAGNVTDNYTLTPIARGFAEHWFHETERRVYDGDMMADALERADDDDLDVMLKKGTRGRVPMHGNYRKDEYGNEVRKFGYYSLQRNLASYPDAENTSVPYRFWSAGALVQDDDARKYWEHMKDGDNDDYGEEFATVKPEGDGFITTDSRGNRLEGSSGDGPRAHSFGFNDIL